MNKSELDVGMVFQAQGDTLFEYGLLAMFEDFVVIESLSGPCLRSKRLRYTYDNFLKTFTKQDRRMSQKETEKYFWHNPNPLYYMTPGIYYVSKSIYNNSSGDFITMEGDIIKILTLECAFNEGPGMKWMLHISFVKFKDMEEYSVWFYENTKFEIIDFFDRVFQKMNTEQSWSLM